MLLYDVYIFSMFHVYLYLKMFFFTMFNLFNEIIGQNRVILNRPILMLLYKGMLIVGILV